MSLRAADADKRWRICFTHGRYSTHDDICFISLRGETPLKCVSLLRLIQCAGKCFQLRSCSSFPRMCSASAFNSHIFLTFISTLIHHIPCWDKLLHVMLVFCYSEWPTATQPQFFFSLPPRWTGTGSKLPVGATARVNGCASLSGLWLIVYGVLLPAGSQLGSAPAPVVL